MFGIIYRESFSRSAFPKKGKYLLKQERNTNDQVNTDLLKKLFKICKPDLS
jgi:hypothetical protein